MSLICWVAFRSYVFTHDVAGGKNGSVGIGIIGIGIGVGIGIGIGLVRGSIVFDLH